MRLRTYDLRGVCVLACHGSILFEAGAEDLGDHVKRELAHAPRGIVLDLTELAYLDSAGIGAVVACSQHAEARGVVLKIALAPAGPVRKIFEVTQLERAFEIFEDVASAASSFA